MQRVSGFGFGIFIMTVLPHVMPSYGEATTLSGLLALVTSLTLVVRWWREISWRHLLPILSVFLVFSFFAVKCIALIDTAVLKRVLGVTLILASLYFYYAADRIRLRPTWPVQGLLGTLSGLMGGFFGMQGPPAVLYFLNVSRTKEAYIALTQAYFLIGNVVMTLYRADSGFFTPTVTRAWCCAVPMVFVGTWLGGKVFRRIRIEALRRVIYAYMALSGVLALCA